MTNEHRDIKKTAYISKSLEKRLEQVKSRLGLTNSEIIRRGIVNQVNQLEGEFNDK